MDGLEYWVNEASGLRRIEDKLIGLWSKWGYREVNTPTLHSWDDINAGRSGVGDRAWKVLDQEGNVLCLRPDVTIPIARLVATDLRDEPRPLRLSYAGATFQRGTMAGAAEERPQYGLELVGVDSPAADAEVLAMAAESLLAFGLDEFRLVVGHMGVLDGVLAGSGLLAEEGDRVKQALQNRDHVALERLVAPVGAPAGRTSLLRYLTEPLTLPLGRAAESLGFPATDDDPSWSRLHEVASIIRGYGLDQYFVFEPGLVRGLGYYTGLVFEVTCPVLAWPVGGGGRYDGLIGAFGKGEPATGFAFDARSLYRVLKARGLEQKPAIPDLLFVADESCSYMAWSKARAYRQQGVAVEVGLENEVSSMMEYARRRGFGKVVRIMADGSEEVLFDRGSR